MNREKSNLIGWRQTLTSSPANHIRFLLVRTNKLAKWKTGLRKQHCISFRLVSDQYNSTDRYNSAKLILLLEFSVAYGPRHLCPEERTEFKRIEEGSQKGEVNIEEVHGRGGLNEEGGAQRENNELWACHKIMRTFIACRTAARR